MCAPTKIRICGACPPGRAIGPMRTSAPTDGGDHAGRGLLDAPDLPPGGRWPEGPDEGGVSPPRWFIVAPSSVSLRSTASPQGEAMMGSPPKPSGDSRGFGGESRSSGMSELSPQAEANDMELATTKGRPRVAARKMNTTTSEAGGCHCAGIALCSSRTRATRNTVCQLRGDCYLPPVNGPLDGILNCSPISSSFSWFLTYSAIRLSFFPTVST